MTKSHDEMSIYELFETDMAMEVEGFWHKVNKMISIKLARSGGSNLAFATAMEKKTRQHRKRGGAFEGDEVDVLVRAHAGDRPRYRAERRDRDLRDADYRGPGRRRDRRHPAP